MLVRHVLQLQLRLVRPGPAAQRAARLRGAVPRSHRAGGVRRLPGSPAAAACSTRVAGPPPGDGRLARG
jgi:hypothetical protein